MKHTLLAIAFVSIIFSGYSQCKIERNAVDEFTGKHQIETAFQVFGKATGLRKLKASVISIDGKHYIFLTANDQGCFNSDSYAAIKFSNGSVLQLQYGSDVHCGVILFSSSIDENALSEFTKNEVTKLRLSSSDNTIDFDVTNSWLLRDHILCIQKASISGKAQ